MNFTNLDFTEVSQENLVDNLFKFVALKTLQTISNNSEKIALSVKHQVLCDATAMVGILKQENSSSLSTKEVVVDFTDKVATLSKRTKQVEN